jgi:hypothetical protein
VLAAHRRTLAFSKKLSRHRAATAGAPKATPGGQLARGPALHYTYKNLCFIQRNMRITPAMAAGITDHVWDLGEMMETALASLAEPAEKPEPKPLVIPTPEGRSNSPSCRGSLGGAAGGDGGGSGIAGARFKAGIWVVTRRRKPEHRELKRARRRFPCSWLGSLG